MLCCPRSLKFFIYIFIIAAFLFFIGYFSYQKLFNHSISSKSEFKNDFSNNVKVNSNISYFSIKKLDSDKFDEILEEWEVFGQNKFFLNSTKSYISPSKIFFHITDREQPYNWVYNQNQELMQSVGEEWDEVNTTLQLFIHLNPTFFKDVNEDILNKYFTRMVLVTLYERTHREDENPIVTANEYLLYFSINKKYPFNISRL